jgi:hypothetical protein
MNLPLYCRQAMGFGIASSLASISATTSETNFRIPFKAASGVADSQLRLGNSAHKPTYSLSSSDHVTLYVYLSFFNAMIYLQFIKSQKHLFHLICLCFSLIILNIDSWISLPRSFIDSVTTRTFTRVAEKLITNFAQIAETNSIRILFHFGYNFINFWHVIIVSILISMSRGKIKKS